MQRSKRPSGSSKLTAPAPRGSVLLVVLVVLAMLTLGAYTFSEFMIVEAQSTEMFGKDAEARTFADSGIELAASLLAQRAEQAPEAYFHNPQWFQGVLMRDSDSAKGRGRFSVVAPIEADPSGRSLRFGLADESSKINLNTIFKLGLSNEQLTTLFAALPGMLPDYSDAILDFIDTDTTPRESGAEDEYYMSLDPPYVAKNKGLDSLDELLMVRGITPEILFGEDANRNGLLDPNENDGETSLPLDNADGLLDRGWSAYFTVYSRELNQRADGTPRTNVNMAALGDLYDALIKDFTDEEALFIIAYRSKGPVQSNSSSGNNTSGNSSNQSGGQSSQGKGSSGGNNQSSQGGSRSGQSGGGNNSNSAGASSGGQSGAQALQDAARRISGVGAGGQVTRGGLDVTAGGTVNINSLYDLIGADVQATINGANTTLKSPWSSDPGAMGTYLPTLMEKLTTRADQFIEGRINIHQAPREVLLGIPGMDETLVESIIGSQLNAMDMAGAVESSDRMTTGWLVTNGLTDLTNMKSLDKYITARGDVFRLQSVGYFEGGGPTSRLEAVIDATQFPAQVVFLRDLTELGRGYSPVLLTTGSEGN